MNIETIVELVDELIGPVDPVGETHTDDRRYENLKKMVLLSKHLRDQLVSVWYYSRDSELYSCKRAADYVSETIGIHVAWGHDGGYSDGGFRVIEGSDHNYKILGHAYTCSAEMAVGILNEIYLREL